jgi:hypothetical protein
MIWVYSKIVNGVKGFKVMLGGVRFQPVMPMLTEFIPANQIIPTTEGFKNFDRYGERANV